MTRIPIQTLEAFDYLYESIDYNHKYKPNKIDDNRLHHFHKKYIDALHQHMRRTQVEQQKHQKGIDDGINLFKQVFSILDKCEMRKGNQFLENIGIQWKKNVIDNMSKYSLLQNPNSYIFQIVDNIIEDIPCEIDHIDDIMSTSLDVLNLNYICKLLRNHPLYNEFKDIYLNEDDDAEEEDDDSNQWVLK